MADPAAMIHPGFAPMPIAKGRFGRMDRMTTNSVVGLCTCALLQSTLAQPTGVRGYEAIQTGEMSAENIDEYGRVIGDIGVVGAQAAVWINGRIHALPTPQGYSWAYEENISPTTGIVVGGTHGPYQPIAWTSHRTYLLRNLGNGECGANSVNDSGWTVGSCTFSNRAALWVPGEPPVDLGDLGGGRAGANDINERGEIVGSSWRAGMTEYVPYLWRDGKMIDLFLEAGLDDIGFASCVNNNGEIVGEVSNRRSTFHWHDGVLTILPEPGPCGLRYLARSINDAGLAVGYAWAPDCTPGGATVWDRNQDFQPFFVDDYLIGPQERWIKSARDINSAGQIAAFGELETGEESSFLVTPYQFDLSEPVPGVAGERNTITVTNLEPNQRVILAFGTKPGAQPIGNGCLGGLVLIRDASTHQSLEAFADNSGVATFNVFVPKSTAGKTVRYQAVAPDECEISHTVEFTF